MLETSLLKRETQLAPVTPEKRFVSLDSLRGFCLLGILLTNVTVFVGVDYPPEGFALTAAGTRVEHLTELLVTSSFRPSLALLFGLGFALQLGRNTNALRTFARRLLVLLAFGLVHGFFIWHGDILSHYAVVGFALMLFAKRSTTTILTWSVAVYGFLPVLATLYVMIPLEPDKTMLAKRFSQAVGFELLYANALAYLSTLRLELLYIPQTLSCFLLGMWLGRRGVLVEPAAHRTFLFASLFTTMLFSFVGRLAFPDNELVDTFFTSPMLGFAYMSLLALLLSVPLLQSILRFFSYVGRMALSNYIAQSFMLSVIFYSFGFGLYGHLRSGEWLWFAFGLYALQVAVSVLWLRRFRYGPLEWLWRRLTYGTRQALQEQLPASVVSTHLPLSERS
jgi:uncharacterized protein